MSDTQDGGVDLPSIGGLLGVLQTKWNEFTREIRQSCEKVKTDLKPITDAIRAGAEFAPVLVTALETALETTERQYRGVQAYLFQQGWYLGADLSIRSQHWARSQISLSRASTIWSKI